MMWWRWLLFGVGGVRLCREWMLSPQTAVPTPGDLARYAPCQSNLPAVFGAAAAATLPNPVSGFVTALAETLEAAAPGESRAPAGPRGPGAEWTAAARH